MCYTTANKDTHVKTEKNGFQHSQSFPRFPVTVPTFSVNVHTFPNALYPDIFSPKFPAITSTFPLSQCSQISNNTSTSYNFPTFLVNVPTPQPHCTQKAQYSQLLIPHSYCFQNPNVSRFPTPVPVIAPHIPKLIGPK